MRLCVGGFYSKQDTILEPLFWKNRAAAVVCVHYLFTVIVCTVLVFLFHLVLIVLLFNDMFVNML